MRIPNTPQNQICLNDPYDENENWGFLGTFEGKWDLWAYGTDEKTWQVHVRWMEPASRDDNYPCCEGFSIVDVTNPERLLEDIFGHAPQGPGIVRALVEAIRRVEMGDDPSVSPGCRR